jgi:ribosomal protein S12 methylthiotransferase accessory factor
MAEHFIPGKDASLEASIAAMQARLAQLGFHVEERSWLHPVENIWSVHLVERDCPLLFTNGKGSSKLAALASALGEFFERLGTRYFWTHYYLGREIAEGPRVHGPDERWFPIDDEEQWPIGLLTPELQRFYNPEGAVDAGALVEINSGNRERGICALPYQRLRDGATVWFPVNIIGNLYVSNGMSAGNTPAEARAQALAEIFERHIKFRVIAEGLCLPDVPEPVIARYPRIQADIRALREAGFGILVKDASLGGEYPVMNVTLLNPADQGIFTSYGAHPRFEIALERALTELLQGRALDALGGFPPPSADLEEVAQPQNLESHFVDSTGLVHWNFLRETPDFPFADWNFSTTTDEDCAWLVERVHADGHDIYLKEFTHLGFYACRLLVPGMSEIYPVDDLEWENNSLGNELREPILHLAELDDEECAELHDALGDLDDQRPIAPLIGLAPDDGSLWKDLRVGELKTLLALAIGEEEAIREGLVWLRHFGQIAPARLRVYRCVEALLELNETEPWEATLGKLFGTGTVELARALLDGNVRFFGAASPGGDLAGCDLHQRLLAAYARIQAADCTAN